MSRRAGKRRGSWLESYVANRYKKAGYKVKKHVMTKKGEIDIIALRGNKKLAVEVKSGQQTITSTEVIKLLRKARTVRAKPALCIGSNVTLTSPARELAKRVRVRIKRLR